MTTVLKKFILVSEIIALMLKTSKSKSSDTLDTHSVLKHDQMDMQAWSPQKLESAIP